MLRAVTFGTAFLLAVAGRAVPAAADSSEEAGEHPQGSGQGSGEEGGDGSSDAASSSRSAGAESSGDDEGAPIAKSKRRRHRSARRHPVVSGRVVPESELRQETLGPPSGELEIYSIGLKEGVKVNIYNDDGSYNIDSLRALDHILRCRRTFAEKPIEPRLLAILSHVYDQFGQRRLEIVSGYRNQRKKTSNHYKGTATDIKIAGINPKRVRAFAETLDTGGLGIGIYPRSAFVHIDVRPLPSYRWVDYSPPNPDASEKRPPRGWKQRKKLQS
jgi:uncharacterized protein YcbK (DUF882 family)